MDSLRRYSEKEQTGFGGERGGGEKRSVDDIQSRLRAQVQARISASQRQVGTEGQPQPRTQGPGALGR